MIQANEGTLREFPNYAISDTGVVRNVETGFIYKAGFNQSGYAHHSLLNRHGKRKTIQVHRLVARVFIPVDPSFGCTYRKLQVDHKDFDICNNSVSNLRWVTKRMNTLRKQHGLPTSPIKLTIERGLVSITFISATAASKFFGTTGNTILKWIHKDVKPARCAGWDIVSWFK